MKVRDSVSNLLGGFKEGKRDKPDSRHERRVQKRKSGGSQIPA